jgi:hypothetical protein
MREPLRYGLKARMYRVWHLGHFTQCRMRSLMTCELAVLLKRPTNELVLRAHVRVTIDSSGKPGWTFADVARSDWTFPDAVPSLQHAPTDERESLVRKRLLWALGAAIMVCDRHGIGPAGMFASTAFARCAFRRKILHWCTRQPRLLPFHLSRAHGEREERPLLSHCRRSRGSRVPALPALPPGMFSRNSSLAGNTQHRVAGLAVDRRERP